MQYKKTDLYHPSSCLEFHGEDLSRESRELHFQNYIK